MLACFPMSLGSSHIDQRTARPSGTTRLVTRINGQVWAHLDSGLDAAFYGDVTLRRTHHGARMMQVGSQARPPGGEMTPPWPRVNPRRP